LTRGEVVTGVGSEETDKGVAIEVDVSITERMTLTVVDGAGSVDGKGEPGATDGFSAALEGIGAETTMAGRAEGTITDCGKVPTGATSITGKNEGGALGIDRGRPNRREMGVTFLPVHVV
jgi:hypothetical protein